MKKWRYLLVNLAPESVENWISFQEILNEYREKGMETVSIVKDDFLKESVGSLLLITKQYLDD